MDRNSGSCFDAGSSSSSEVLEYALQRRSIARKVGELFWYRCEKFNKY